MPSGAVSLEELIKKSEWLAKKYGVHPPKIKVVNKLAHIGEYEPLTETVYIRSDVLNNPKLAARVVLHETAHHIDNVKGISIDEQGAEMLAHAFEIYAYHDFKDDIAAVVGAFVLGMIVTLALRPR